MDALPVGSALLVVQRGPGAGSRFLLDKDVVTAGRHADSEIFLDDVTVSRRHATFTREGDTFTVADAGSLNGTYVNRDRIDTVVLKDTDEVQIGKYRLVFFQGHESQVDRAAPRLRDRVAWTGASAGPRQRAGCGSTSGRSSTGCAPTSRA